MIFPTAVCLVLSLSSTLANQEQVVQLIDRIASKAAGEMAQVAAANSAVNNLTELNNKILETMRHSLEQMEPQIKELDQLSGGSPDLAKDLSEKINQNLDLKSALISISEGKKAPRFIGSSIIGITQIVTDVINMALRRY